MCWKSSIIFPEMFFCILGLNILVLSLPFLSSEAPRWPLLKFQAVEGSSRKGGGGFIEHNWMMSGKLPSPAALQRPPSCSSHFLCSLNATMSREGATLWGSPVFLPCLCRRLRRVLLLGNSSSLLFAFSSAGLVSKSALADQLLPRLQSSGFSYSLFATNLRTAIAGSGGEGCSSGFKIPLKWCFVFLFFFKLLKSSRRLSKSQSHW